jgi:hypothetical protein
MESKTMKHYVMVLPAGVIVPGGVWLTMRTPRAR